MEINAEECLKSGNNLNRQADIRSILMTSGNPAGSIRFSVVVPTYKRLSTLKTTIESILAQKTDVQYDIIVVEDNPELDTEIGHYLLSLNDSRIKYYKNEKNLGLVGNFNRVLSLGDGDIVAIIHDDDFLLPDYISEMDRVMRARPDADIVCPKPFKWDAAGPLRIPEECGKPARLWKPLICGEPFYRTFIPTGMAIRRSSIGKSGGFDYISGPSTDLYFIVRAGISGLTYYNYDKTLFVYRWSENESLKFETRKTFIEAGFPLRRHILEHSRLPKFVRNALLRNYCARGLTDIRTNFPDHEFDSSFLMLPHSERQRSMDTRILNIAGAFLTYRKYFFPLF